MKKFILIALLQHAVFIGFGQFKLSGVVTGKGEPLAGASIVILNSYYGISSSTDGSFKFTNLKRGEYKLKVSFIGFESREIKIAMETDKKIEVELTPGTVLTDEILVSATRANEKTPMAYTNLGEEQIEQRNMGQDIPYLLQLSPSFVATSDAGAGVGYTNFRIRGTDLNRINVSVNGIPLNDAESHGTWFVDLPDLGSSLENVQIQRGVGTSANGAAAFGATINLQTNSLEKKAYGKYNTAFGSFNTFKNTAAAGTGLLKGKFTLDARLSKITSNGYIDRASSDLRSFFVSAGYYTTNTVLKANVFTGFEETYQAWWGVPSVRLNNDLAGMQRYGEHWLYSEQQTKEMIESDSRTYNYYTYENQVDNYQQDHYQLHFSHKFNENWNLNASAHYTYGRGYYENFEPEEDHDSYNLPEITFGPVTITTSDIVNRKWLDNDFYGITYSLNYSTNKNELTIGGGFNTYDGDHFGNVIWEEFTGNEVPDHEWYNNRGLKHDFNVFAKYLFNLTNNISIFTDLQFRKIDYSIEGIDDDQRILDQSHDFNFFNPKTGLYYKIAGNQNLYVSYAVAHREPNRTAFVDKDPSGKTPGHETLKDLELGYNFSSSRFSFAANYYFMSYDDQLVLTGEINDVGAPIMVNVENSNRTGLELQSGIKLYHNFLWNTNVTFSRNKITDFTEYVDNWDTGEQESYDLGNTDLAFSPGIVANSQFEYHPSEAIQIALATSYVGSQYIDNSSNDDRKISAYLVNNLTALYTISTPLFKEITFRLMVNNIFNEKYESNAWVYSYILGGERYKMDGYYPQAGRHFMFGVNFNF